MKGWIAGYRASCGQSMEAHLRLNGTTLECSVMEVDEPFLRLFSQFERVPFADGVQFDSPEAVERYVAGRRGWTIFSRVEIPEGVVR